MAHFIIPLLNSSKWVSHNSDYTGSYHFQVSIGSFVLSIILWMCLKHQIFAIHMAQFKGPAKVNQGNIQEFWRLVYGQYGLPGGSEVRN